MISEQRSHVRLPLDGKVLIRREDGGLALRAGLHDVSLSGFRMLAEEELEVGRDVEFRMEAHTLGHCVRGAGRVRNVAPVKKWGAPYYAMGLEFTRVEGADVARLLEKKRRGWEWKRKARQPDRRDIGIVLLLAPVLFLVSSWCAGVFAKSEASGREAQRYTLEFNAGVLHFLFNSK